MKELNSHLLPCFHEKLINELLLFLLLISVVTTSDSQKTVLKPNKLILCNSK
jgi:hypothetical protein